jgi:hypothetical protein
MGRDDQKKKKEKKTEKKWGTLNSCTSRHSTARALIGGWKEFFNEGCYAWRGVWEIFLFTLWLGSFYLLLSFITRLTISFGWVGQTQEVAT